MHVGERLRKRFNDLHFLRKDIYNCFPFIKAALDELVKSSPFHGEEYEFEPHRQYNFLVQKCYE